MKFSDNEKQKDRFTFKEGEPQQFKLKEVAEKEADDFSRGIKIFISCLLISGGLLYYGYSKTGALPNPVLFILAPLMVVSLGFSTYLRILAMRKRLAQTSGQSFEYSNNRILANALIAIGLTVVGTSIYWIALGPTGSGLQKVGRNFADNEIAHNLYEKNNDIEAVKAYDTAIGAEPINPILYEGRGFCYLRQSQNQKALEDMNQAIKVAAISTENSVRAYECRGLYYYNIGQFENAVADFTKAISLVPPKDGNLYRERARAYGKWGKEDLASKDLAAAEAIFQKNQH